MKKLLCVLLAMAMVFALGACGGDDSANQAPEKETASVPAEEPAEAPADKPAEGEDAAPAEEETKALTVGVIDGKTYENEYLNLGCTVPENWEILGPEDLQELGEIVDGVLEDTKYADAPTIQDLYAINPETGVNVNIVLTKMSKMDRLTMSKMTEEEIVENTLKSKDDMIAAYTQAGMEIASLEGTTFEFLGEEHHAIKTVFSTQGVDAVMVQVFNFHSGGEYGGTVTFTALSEDELPEMAAMFYALEK